MKVTPKPELLLPNTPRFHALSKVIKFDSSIFILLQKVFGTERFLQFRLPSHQIFFFFFFFFKKKYLSQPAFSPLYYGTVQLRNKDIIILQGFFL